MENLKNRLISLVAICSDYCVTLENARELDNEELTASLLNYLPRIYWEFGDIEAPEDTSLEEWGSNLTEHLDEEQYNAVQSTLASIFGEDDTYLETFEKDMKYSETPIATSISENLADIYQPLYNFVVEVRESAGDSLEEAFRQCKEDFAQYWAQTLCNVLRPLNALRYA